MIFFFVWLLLLLTGKFVSIASPHIPNRIHSIARSIPGGALHRGDHQEYAGNDTATGNRTNARPQLT